MVIYFEVWIILIATYSSAEVAYYSPYGLDKVEEGSNVTISCYFKGNKPPGPSMWELTGEVQSVDCSLNTKAIEIICTPTDNCSLNSNEIIFTPTDDCSPDPGNGHANYSFIISQVSLDRDRNNWVCMNTGFKEPLYIPIVVIGKPENHKGKGEYKVGENLNVTTHIGCSYPPGEVLWCLELIGQVTANLSRKYTTVKCSNETNWAADVFETDPSTNNTSEACTEYITPNVSKYVLTIQGTVTSRANGATYELYCSLNGVDYRTNRTTISLQKLEEAPCNHVLLTITLVVHAIAIVYVIASMIIILITCKHKVMFFFGITNAVLFIFSLSLYIPSIVFCQVFDLVVAVSVLFGVISVLCGVMVTVSVIWIFRKRNSNSNKANANMNEMKTNKDASQLTAKAAGPDLTSNEMPDEQKNLMNE